MLIIEHQVVDVIFVVVVSYTTGFEFALGMPPSEIVPEFFSAVETTVMNSIAGNENRTHAFHEASIKRDQLGQKPDDHMTSAKVSQECSSNDCLDHYICPHLLRFRPEI